jgi:hypothetical protein
MLALGLDLDDSMGMGAGPNEDGMDGYIERVLTFSSQLATLGQGDAERMYPADPGHVYRDDLEWRVML